MDDFRENCPVCGCQEFMAQDVLWPALIDAWGLLPNEVSYINRQQGFHCTSCMNNLRAMALAQAILYTYKSDGPLKAAHKQLNSLKLLEINCAGNLTPILATFSGHQLVEYPDTDMQKMQFTSDSYDLIIHSDTLEHIKNPVEGLRECKRILKPGGACIFTVPIIVDRLSRSREGLVKSFHGSPNVDQEEQIVWTEFGSDFWTVVMKAGFRSCEMFSIEFPAGLAVICRKDLAV